MSLPTPSDPASAWAAAQALCDRINHLNPDPASASAPTLRAVDIYCPFFLRGHGSYVGRTWTTRTRGPLALKGSPWIASDHPPFFRRALTAALAPLCSGPRLANLHAQALQTALAARARAPAETGPLASHILAFLGPAPGPQPSPAPPPPLATWERTLTAARQGLPLTDLVS